MDEVLKLAPVGEILKRTWTLFTERLNTLTAIVALPALLYLVLIFIPRFMDGSALLIVIYFLVMVALLITTLWAHIAISTGLNASSPISGGEAYRQSKNKIISVIWINILAALIIGAGYVLAIIPGIVFSFWFLFVGIVLVVENKRGMDALMRSKSLVRGRFWGVVWRFIVVIVLTIIPYLALSWLSSIAGSTAQIVIDTILRCAMSMFWATALFIIYKSLSESQAPNPPEEKKGLYTGFAIFGLVALIVIFFVGVVVGVLGAMSENYDPAIYPPPLPADELPN